MYLGLERHVSSPTAAVAAAAVSDAVVVDLLKKNPP
jgi:hypothetical protein